MVDFLVALGLVLVIEGLVFAAIPRQAQAMMRQASETPGDVLRAVGLGSAVLGVIVIAAVRWWST